MGHLLEAVIVGGGVAGLGCARTLVEHGINDFVVLTENIGGRIATSNDGHVNYGAFYVRRDYRHILQYVSLKRRVSLAKMGFVEGNSVRCFFALRNWSHTPGLIRLWRFLHRFRRHVVRFRKNSVSMSQFEALLQDPWLMRIYGMPAVQLIQELRIQYLVDHFLSALVWSTAFQEIRKVSAAYFAGICLLMVIPAFEFEFQMPRLIAPFLDQIKIDSVVGISTTGETWKVRCASGRCFRTKNVVVATTISQARKLIPITEPTNHPVSVYLFHVAGALRSQFMRRSLLLLSPEIDSVAIVHEPDDTCLFFSRDPEPDLDTYFVGPKIIAQRHWDPALYIGPEVIESNRGSGLYLIGDHNACSLEDAFITGLYAAGQIATHRRQLPDRPRLVL